MWVGNGASDSLSFTAHDLRREKRVTAFRRKEASPIAWPARCTKWDHLGESPECPHHSRRRYDRTYRIP